MINMVVSKLTSMSNVKVLRGVRALPSYNDVMSHANPSTQQSYFSAKAKYSLSEVIPIRNNVIRLPYPADSLYDCNYIMWQNVNFGNKWFYAFITRITWININCSELELEMDVWETWQFSLSFAPCFVERMHVNDDTFGKWLAPEPLDVSNKLLRLNSMTNFGSDSRIIVYWIPNEQFLPSWIGDCPMMCYQSSVAPSEFEEFFETNLQPLIDVGLQDNIIGAVVIPTAFARKSGSYRTTLSRGKFMNLDGYTPANKKLLTFPYNSIRIGSQNGVQAEYMLEKFEDNSMEFQVIGQPALDCILYGSFVNYERTDLTPVRVPNSAYTSIVSGFPQPLMTGLQSLGYAQTTSALTMSALTRVEDFVAKPVNAVQDLFANSGEAGKIGQKLWDANLGILPDLYKGKKADLERSAQAQVARITGLPSSTSAWEGFRADFQFLHSTIDAVRAEMYDKYLTRWGYSVQTITAPLISGREVFNYVQTNGCVVYGNVGQEDLNVISQIFDNGVTIWHQERGHEIGSWGGSAAGNQIVG